VVGEDDRDILPRDQSVLDMVRIAAYIHQIPAAIDMIQEFDLLKNTVRLGAMFAAYLGLRSWPPPSLPASRPEERSVEL
jgi:hypothetical protein